ncbi:PTS system mannose/fructose/N-acetylgalactosamine-transporter subunit IIB [Holdemania filiformis]|uniref:PTS system mannose/fructose/N-acetylgalactosamine-transporter subunit IIB n=1 Tax=Holdemania filiformis TaxID=61171 RepID=UPI001C70985C|nr:PTS sugar transporter subunit IIB [Holdemania filiformis]MBS5002371.1 PTS sugar transporter subunit IIB [Holdemania filiformis]
MKEDDELSIEEIRIDDRLIHGQVCGFWIPYFSITRILIVDEEIGNDPIRKTALKIGCPPNVGLSILDSKTAADKLNRNLDKKDKVLILSRSPQPLLSLYNYGYVFHRITIGNLSQKENSIPICKTVYADPSDFNAFNQLAERGIHLISRMIPSEPEQEVTEMIKKISEDKSR